MAIWHFIIPFYYGKNQYVVKKGGAPVDRKIDYLKLTVSSIQRLGVDSSITIFVCDEPSRVQALKVHEKIQKLECHPKHLPLEAVKAFQSWFNNHGSPNDIVAFNEDDQILYLSDNVKADIQNTTDNVIFSPHRWAKLLFIFRRKKRPLFRFQGSLGVLDNIGKLPTGNEYRYNYTYNIQVNRGSAYAACWFMKGYVFKIIDFTVPDEQVVLESPSFAVFDSGIPVLKLRFDKIQPLSDFLVDHLSGYDYNRRMIKFF
jgi:hypothetical protein